MIIKKISIENYLCYCGLKEFELSDGLNIILGENGEGKTKFFEAIEWLFNGDGRNLEALVSAKAIDQADINDQLKVRVGIAVEQFEEIKIISKSFIVKKTGKSEFRTSNFNIEGIEETKAGERSQVDGQTLLDRVFPPEIRRYSMFKGESQLDIFKNDDALITLINSFSNAKHYEKYALKGEFLRTRAEKAVEDSTRDDQQNQQEYKRIEREIFNLSEERERTLVFINNSEEQITKTEEYIQDADKYVTNAEALEIINDRIKNIEADILSASNRIDENFTTALFDERWILVNFEKIHHLFSKKISDLSAKKRELQSEFDQKKGIREGRKQLTAELFNKSIPLPTGVPSKAHMKEMLKEELCKVCNRPAPKGSEAYEFMMARLKDYVESQQPLEKEPDEPVLFKNDYTNRLFNLSVSHEDGLANLRQINGNIADLFEYNKERREELASLNDRLNAEFAEREKIIGSSSIGAEKLGVVLKNYTAWQKALKSYNRDLEDYKRDLATIDAQLKTLKEKKDGIDMVSANSFLIKTRAILRDIETIFKDTKEQKFNEFIRQLQDKSNNFFDIINIDAFIGNIVFEKKVIGGKTKVNIELQEADGSVVRKPNQSLETSMHISILFAISELAAELREENFPMIFDAPTSSFGETKTGQFLNLIYETETQKILLIKDFLATDEKTKKLYVKKEFNKINRDKAFWISLERPFDRKKLNTLNTQVISL